MTLSVVGILGLTGTTAVVPAGVAAAAPAVAGVDMADSGGTLALLLATSYRLGEPPTIRELLDLSETRRGVTQGSNEGGKRWG